MPSPLRLPPLDPADRAELRRLATTGPAEARRRYRMVWLALLGQDINQISQAVARSPDTVTRVLHRFLAGGLPAVPRRPPSGRPSALTPAARLVLLDLLASAAPPTDGVGWTTAALARALARRAGLVVSAETVRRVLLARGFTYDRTTRRWRPPSAAPDGAAASPTAPGPTLEAHQ